MGYLHTTGSTEAASIRSEAWTEGWAGISLGPLPAPLSVRLENALDDSVCCARVLWADRDMALCPPEHLAGGAAAADHRLSGRLIPCKIHCTHTSDYYIYMACLTGRSLSTGLYRMTCRHTPPCKIPAVSLYMPDVMLPGGVYQ